jgi:hypothetical protein
MSHVLYPDYYGKNVGLYRLKKDATFRARFRADALTALAAAELTEGGAPGLRAVGRAQAERAGRLAPPPHLHPRPWSALEAPQPNRGGLLRRLDDAVLE